MLKKYLKKLFSFIFEIKDYNNLTYHKNIVITFTGGLGAQIFSASIYKYLESNNYNVYGDFRYFETNELIRNKTKGISYWEWQLSEYDIEIKDFKKIRYNFLFLFFSNFKFINDGDLKLNLAILSLKFIDNKSIFKKNIFTIKNIIDSELYNDLNNQYIALHMRKGDFVNVATLVIPEDFYIKLLFSINLNNKNLIILSDSKLSTETYTILKAKFNNLKVYDDNKLTPFISHVIMTNASYLICSNSQFSFSAGLLNEGIVYYPSKWSIVDSINFKNIMNDVSNFHIKFNV
jgi:hypothetical protein